jgi:cell division protein FtsW
MMYRFNAEKLNESPRIDHILAACIILLTGIGMVTLYSASYYFAGRFKGDNLYFTSRQLIFGGVGILLFFAASYIDLEKVRKFIKLLIIFSLILCGLTFVPGIKYVRNGAARWIHIGGLTYQPSEMVKFVLPLYLAHFFDKKRDSMDNFKTGILPSVLVCALFFVLIYLQNNFSTAVFIMLNALVVFWLAGVKLRYFISAVMIFLPLSALLVLSKEHRVHRIISFLWPELDPQGASYQVNSSLISIGSGSFWGKGIGHGTRKIVGVPEIHSDFIFSAYAEETGFIGILLFFGIFLLFAIRGYRASLRADSVFKQMLSASLVTVIVSQVLVNIAVVSGTLPATGIPLPFFSAGGSSLATTLICMGLIVNVSRPSGNMTGQENLYVE